MTILYHIASTTWGGGEQYVFDLASAMQQRGHQCIFIAHKKSNSQLLSRFRTIGRIYAIGNLRSLHRFLPFLGKTIADIIDSEHVDVVHINSRQVYFAVAWAKHFSTRHFTLIASQHLVRQAKDNRLWRWAYRHIDTLVCVSNIVKSNYTNRDLKNSIVIRNSIVVATKYLNAQKTDSDIPIILYHGRVCREKGISHLLDAVRMLNTNFILRIVGDIDPKYEPELKNKSKGLEGKLEFIGFQEDVGGIVSRATIGVIPSIVPEAGGPLALVENLAYGLPTIASKHGSQIELIKHGDNGLLYEPNNIQSLSQTIATLLSDSQLRMKIALNGQIFYNNNLNYNNIVDKYESIYKQI